VETARALSPETQVIELDLDEVADLIAAQAERARGDFATEAEVEAVMSKYRF
jgi:hypothetical protein